MPPSAIRKAPARQGEVEPHDDGSATHSDYPGHGHGVGALDRRICSWIQADPQLEIPLLLGSGRVRFANHTFSIRCEIK